MLIKTFCAEVMGLEATTITIEEVIGYRSLNRGDWAERTFISNSHLCDQRNWCFY